jgi:ABC-type nitrate/sulfonate/bicarbonate transport system substrate-binding protein
MTRTLLAAALAALVATPTLAQEEKTSLALPALTITFTPVYVAKDLGIWQKEGLDVDIHNIVGLGSTNAMLSGSVDFGVQSGPTLIRGNMRGQKMMGVSLMAAGVAFELTMRKEAAGGMTVATPLAQRAASLKGKKIAVDSPNSVVEGFLRYVAAKGGLSGGRDYTMSFMQPPEMLAALRTGTIDGGVHTFPWTKTSQRQGDVLFASGIIDVPDLLPTVGTSTTTRPDFCDKKPSVCTKLVRGYVLAHAYIHDHPKEALEVLKKRMPNTHMDDLTGSFAEMVKTTPKVPSFPAASFANAQRLMLVGGMIKEDEQVKDFSAMYTNKFVK